MPTDTANKMTGTVVQVIGPVIDADFTGAQMPKIYDAIEIDFEVSGKPVKLTLEVQQHLGESWVRAIAMSSTEGLKRGTTVTNTAAPISVPVGEGVLGRVFNVTGDPWMKKAPWSRPSATRSIAPLLRSSIRTPRPRSSRPASRSST